MHTTEWTTADLHHVRPHTSPTAVAYRASAEDTATWKAESWLARLSERETCQEVADAWRDVLAPALDRQGARAYATRCHPTPGQTPRRRHRYHWQLTARASYDTVLPHCHAIASNRARGHAHAPDLRTTVGRRMQADLDTLTNLPRWHADILFDLPGDGSVDLQDASGRRLGRDTTISADGCRYVLWEAPPAQAPDPAVWAPVPVREYIELLRQPTTTPAPAHDEGDR